MKQKFLITTALPYANGDIHLGHLVEYLQADFWVRFLKMFNMNDVYFFCADDAHGTPIMLKAKEAKITPNELIQDVLDYHKKDFDDFQVNFTHYSSTHSQENQTLCYEFYNNLVEGNHIVKEEIEQAYSEKDQIFLPDRFIIGTCPKCHAEEQYGDNCEVCGSLYSTNDLIQPRSRISGSKIIRKKTEHLFVKLETFRSFLKEWLPNVVSKNIFNKLDEWLKAPLKNWDISRDAPYFGFEIPNEENKYFYVWLDAPIGYISTTKEWCLQNNQNYTDYWQNANCQIYHFIGKDIVYFHTLFWPIMLKANKYSLPNQIFVHGFLTINGAKMSKSKKTFIKARTYLKYLKPDYFRYYLASKLNNTVEDIDLNIEDFVLKVNSDIVGKITNLGSRSIQMLIKFFDGVLPTLNPNYKRGNEMLSIILQKNKEIKDHFYSLQFSKGVQLIRDLADRVNEYFTREEPWKLKENNFELAHQVLGYTVHCFRALVIYLHPILPEYSSKVATMLHEDSDYHWEDIHKKIEDIKIIEYIILLERIQLAEVKKIIEAS